MKKYIILVSAISLFLIYLQVTASKELKWIALTVVILAVIALAATIFILFWWSSEKMKSIKADRIEREKSAHVMVVSTNSETWIRDTGNAEWHNLTGTPMLRVNGIDRLPTELELKLHRERLLLENQCKTTEIVNQLPAEIEDKSETLFDLLKAYSHIMFIAGTGSGKTTQINHCIDWHLRQDKYASIIWLSTHTNLDIYENNIHPQATCFQQPQTIARVLDEQFEVYQKRRDNAGQYSKLVIALDEWPETVYEVADWLKAGDILCRMSNGSRKTNISLILAGQGASVADLDTKGRSSIKFNFAEVQLSARMTQQNKAIWMNNRERKEISLPGLFYSPGNNRVIEYPEIKSKEQEWLELVENGMSKNEACWQVFNRQFAGDLVGKLNRYASTTE